MTTMNRLRASYKPTIASVLCKSSNIRFVDTPSVVCVKKEITPLFPFLKTGAKLSLAQNGSSTEALRVGVVFSGGQAPGGHNVIAGIYDTLKELNNESELIGFLNGPAGILENRAITISAEQLDPYRNMGGFDLLGSGRTKIESQDDIEKAARVISSLNLQGLIIIGGDDSNTNAAVLAEHFLANKVPCHVVGVPKTIDGDLKGFGLETSFGFDTATKTFSNTIGNIARDALSAQKYYFFIRLMGRSASHITLECAMQTRPNKVFISEEIAAKKHSLKAVVDSIADTICKRSEKGKEYGVILIPEGMIEFIPEVKRLIQALNRLLADQVVVNKLEGKNNLEQKVSLLLEELPKDLQTLFSFFPRSIQSQLILERDPHGNVQVSKIEMERLLIELVGKELKAKREKGAYSGKFSAVPLFLGYEGRSCYPSNFDANYCYNLGIVATVLINSGKTGYMACLQNLTLPATEWLPTAIPIIEMLTLEERKGSFKPVIEKALVDIQSDLFQMFLRRSASWELEDEYRYPAPIQFFGSEETTDSVTITLDQQKQTLSVV